MFLKSLTLENIRSYSSQKIEFPSGSVLLAGDIGSGKSTILLAIEFALFGVKPGELTGGALLRHGCKNGFVELNFECEGKEVVVKRTLKKSKERVAQAPGHVTINGVQTDMMPKEIRAKIFEILHYPQALVAKGQDLIYRFTVYTPQEQMRQIIYEDRDTRLETLRKVFNIDKYKRIRENSLVYTKFLRAKRNNFEGRISDLEDKKKQLGEIENEIRESMSRVNSLSEKFENSKKLTSDKKLKLKDLEEQAKKNEAIKKDIALLDSELKNILATREHQKKDIHLTDQKIAILKKSLKDFKDEDYDALLKDIEEKIKEQDKILLTIRVNKSKISGKVGHIKETADKVKELDDCPLCLQKVPHDHKKDIIQKSNKELQELKDEFSLFEKDEMKQEALLLEFKGKQNALQKKMNEYNVMKLKKEHLTEQEKRSNELNRMLLESKKRIGQINAKKLDLRISEDLEDKYDIVKKEYESALQEERKAEIDLNSVKKEKEGMENQKNSLKNEVQDKESIKKELKKIIQLYNWINTQFIPLTTNIEKHVMMTVYHEFNAIFQRWFDILIEDEYISVRLDDSFTVTIEQNGYETFIEHLSGGEKTSIALAYRLALNRVINDVMSYIRTKDILILDEPTEGFSTDQLDKMRDVLQQLGIKQIIIVSHEAKIESYVDKVIRVEKQEGISSIS